MLEGIKTKKLIVITLRWIDYWMNSRRFFVCEEQSKTLALFFIGLWGIVCESCLVCLRVSISRRLVLVCNHEPPSSSLKVVPLIGLDCKGLGLLISIVRFLLILARVLQIESLGSPSILSLLISLVPVSVESFTPCCRFACFCSYSYLCLLSLFVTRLKDRA